MESRVILERSFIDMIDQIPQECDLAYLKLIGVGSRKLEELKVNPKLIQELCVDQDGFYLICQRDKLREELHAIVDRFCDKKEKL